MLLTQPSCSSSGCVTELSHILVLSGTVRPAGVGHSRAGWQLQPGEMCSGFTFQRCRVLAHQMASSSSVRVFPFGKCSDLTEEMFVRPWEHRTMHIREKQHEEMRNSVFISGVWSHVRVWKKRRRISR